MEPDFSPWVQYLFTALYNWKVKFFFEFIGSYFLFNLLSSQSTLFFVSASLSFEDSLLSIFGALEFSPWSRNGSGFIE